MFGEKWISEARAADATEMVRKESDVRLMRLSSKAQLALLAAVCLIVPGCEDDDASPTGPTPVTGGATGSAGATEVRGTERLVWNQVGDTSRLRFRAYVNGRAVDLPSATCDGATPEAECSSPLPALTDGVHTIELVNVSSAGIESPRTGPITLQKVTARSTIASLPLASARGGLRMEPVITIADGLSFTADVVATAVRAPAQLAWLPDGRLLLAEADGRVRVVRPGDAENRQPALEAGMLASQQVGAMGIASHPDFAQNRFVYVSLLESDRTGATRLRLLRLREIGDALGEAATLFDAPVAGDASVSQSGPRMAFGPDRLLYVMLPPGLEFVNEPAASTPQASMLRLTDEGRSPSAGPLAGVTATPLAFAWHQTSGALWLMFRGGNGDAAMRSLETRARAMRAEPAPIRVREGVGASAGTLLLQSAPDDLLVARALVGTRSDGSGGMARLTLPVQSAERMSDRIGDVVAGANGTLFVTTSNAVEPNSAAIDAVVRLTPVPAQTAR